MRLSNIEQMQVDDLRRFGGPNGGLLVCRAARANSFIGGTRHGLKEIPTMVRRALDDLDRFDEDLHIETLISGAEREAFAGVAQWEPVRRTRTAIRRRKQTIRISSKGNCPTGK